MSGTVWAIRSLFEAQAHRFFVLVQICPADHFLRPGPGGDRGILFTHNVVRGCVRSCVTFLCCMCSTSFGKTLLPLAGLSIVPPFVYGIRCFLISLPAVPVGLWLFCCLTSASYKRLCSPSFRRGLYLFLWFVCRGLFLSRPLPPHRPYAAWVRLVVCLVVGSAFLSNALLRVFLAL